MDVMLLGLMALPNQVVYIQFHPVAYVSLNSQSLLFMLHDTDNNDRWLNSISK
jgi:hypothetical protein